MGEKGTGEEKGQGEQRSQRSATAPYATPAQCKGMESNGERYALQMPVLSATAPQCSSMSPKGERTGCGV